MVVATTAVEPKVSFTWNNRHGAFRRFRVVGIFFFFLLFTILVSFLEHKVCLF